MKIRKFKMRAGTFTAVVMVTASMTAVITEKCEKLDPELWNYLSCPDPESQEWIRLKIKMNCDKDLYYHCASNSQGCDIQQCVKRVYCDPGHRPMLDPSKDTAVCVPCTPDLYQTIGFWSNERSYCEHEKTKCDRKGQIECQPGSATTDRSCRCNIHQNLALESYALHNATCCTNNDQLCYCVNFKSPCPNGTVRHDNYKCLAECPPNSFRQWDSETCYPNSTTVKVEMTTSTGHQISTSRGSLDTVVVGLVVGLIIAGILVGLVVGLWVWHRRKKRNNGHRNDEEQARPLQDLMTNKGQVIVCKKYKIVNNKTTNKVYGGKGNTVNLAEKNRTQTNINENCPMGSEDSDSLKPMESSNGRNSTGGENPENQLNPHRPGHKMPQQQTQEKGTESVMSTDTEPEHRPVEHEERVEQHMAKLKQHTGNDQSRIPEEISMNDSISEETTVKWTQSDPDEIMEEVRPEEMQRPIQDNNSCSRDEIKKKEIF